MGYKLTTTLSLLFILTGLASGQKPNVIFFLVDDMGYMDIAAFGSDFYETPNVDQLAADGMMFTNGYAASPICSPTRMSIVMGTNPGRNDMTQWIGGGGNPSYTNSLPAEETTIAEALKEGGYATAFFGKWHLNSNGNDGLEHWPQSHGFDVNWGGHWRGGPYVPNQFHAPYVDGDGNLLPNFEEGPPGEYLTDRLAQEVNEFIEAEKDGPFFAYLSFYSVHNPMDAPQDRIAPYNQKRSDLGLSDAERFVPNDLGGGGANQIRVRQDHPTYAAMVESVDMAVGTVVEKLEELNLTDNTIIFFFSDNGGLSTSEGTPTSNIPYKAGKGWLYEGGIKEPLVVKWPGVAEPGSVSDAFVLSTDFYPTILEMAGLDLMPEQHEDGVSFVGLLNQTRVETRSTMFYHYPHNSNQGGRRSSAIRVRDWKLINHYENDHRLELFNIAEDISEENDLSGDMPELADSLLGMLQKWQGEVDAKFPSGYQEIPNITPLDPPAVDETVEAKGFDASSELNIRSVRFVGNTLQLKVLNSGRDQVKAALYDVTGKTLVAESSPGSAEADSQVHVKFENLSHSKVYFLQVNAGNRSAGKKIMGTFFN